MKKLFTLLTTFICAIAMNATELFLVGDATPAGWNLGNLDQTQMTEVSTNVFEWTGVLLATPTGEGFKILTQRDWNPGMHPSEAALKIDLAGQDVVALAYSGDPDTKWQVSKTAEYTIRVTLRAEDALVECIEQGAVNVGVPCVDGVYQITTAEHAAKFAEGINSGIIENNCSVVLTQDLDLESIEKWNAIGTDSKKFMGTFDGQNHRIMNMHIDGSKKEQGFFGVVGPGAVIKNAIIDASCVIVGTDGQCMAAFAGCCNNDGTITFLNCGNEANITGTKQNNAAFVGCNYGGGCHLEFYNCYNTGNIAGGWENGAFSGWCGGGAKFFNCYNAGNVTEGETWARGNKEMTDCYQTVGADEGVNQIDAALLASGELCYLLGAPFTQNIGVDLFPTFGHSEVFAYADGTFGNTPVLESPYVGSDLAEGTFYLRNVDFGTWLGDNDRNTAYGWTSHAEIGARGRDIIITAIDGGYQLNPQTSGNHSINANNLYMDTSSAVTAWTITPVDSHTDAKVFAITCGDKGLCVNDWGDMDENSGKHNLWQLVTRAERLSVETANATLSEPADISWAVLGGTFPVADDHKNDGTWQGEKGSNANGGDGYYHCNRVWEFWGITDRNVYQEIADIPNGMYGVQANAIYVSTGNDGVNADRYNDYITGAQETKGFIYASAKNEKAVEMVNMYSLVTDERVNDRNTRDLGNGKWALNGTNEYSTHIFEGDGLTEEARVDVNNNTITVGAKVVEGTGSSWILIDNFRLFYYGDKVATGIENVESATTNKTFKTIENGKVVIYRNDAKYNVNGMMIK